MNEKMLQPETTEKPWGFFRRFTLNEASTVKILHIDAGEEFSLQDHQHRVEFWRITRGSPTVTIGGNKIRAKEGDEFVIPEKVLHRISAEYGPVEVLEISIGQFDETDIERVLDKYGRVTEVKKAQ
jgi:mannose-6-phosphate isomerase-like protein (cupin superfamily)